MNTNVTTNQDVNRTTTSSSAKTTTTMNNNNDNNNTDNHKNINSPMMIINNNNSHSLMMQHASILCGKGRKAWLIQDYSTSLQQFGTALRILESTLGSYHPLVAKTLYWIGFIYKSYLLTLVPQPQPQPQPSQPRPTSEEGGVVSSSSSSSTSIITNSIITVRYLWLALIAFTRSARIRWSLSLSSSTTTTTTTPDDKALLEAQQAILWVIKTLQEYYYYTPSSTTTPNDTNPMMMMMKDQSQTQTQTIDNDCNKDRRPNNVSSSSTTSSSSSTSYCFWDDIQLMKRLVLLVQVQPEGGGGGNYDGTTTTTTTTSTTANEKEQQGLSSVKQSSSSSSSSSSPYLNALYESIVLEAKGDNLLRKQQQQQQQQQQQSQQQQPDVLLYSYYYADALKCYEEAYTIFPDPYHGSLWGKRAFCHSQIYNSNTYGTDGDHNNNNTTTTPMTTKTTTTTTTTTTKTTTTDYHDIDHCYYHLSMSVHCYRQALKIFISSQSMTIKLGTKPIPTTTTKGPTTTTALRTTKSTDGDDSCTGGTIGNVHNINTDDCVPTTTTVTTTCNSKTDNDDIKGIGDCGNSNYYGHYYFLTSIQTLRLDIHPDTQTTLERLEQVLLLLATTTKIQRQPTTTTTTTMTTTTATTTTEQQHVSVETITTTTTDEKNDYKNNISQDVVSIQRSVRDESDGDDSMWQYEWIGPLLLVLSSTGRTIDNNNTDTGATTTALSQTSSSVSSLRRQQKRHNDDMVQYLLKRAERQYSTSRSILMGEAVEMKSPLYDHTLGFLQTSVDRVHAATAVVVTTAATTTSISVMPTENTTDRPSTDNHDDRKRNSVTRDLTKDFDKHRNQHWEQEQKQQQQQPSSQQSPERSLKSGTTSDTKSSGFLPQRRQRQHAKRESKGPDVTDDVDDDRANKIHELEQQCESLRAKVVAQETTIYQLQHTAHTQKVMVDHKTKEIEELTRRKKERRNQMILDGGSNSSSNNNYNSVDQGGHSVSTSAAEPALSAIVASAPIDGRAVEATIDQHDDDVVVGDDRNNSTSSRGADVRLMSVGTRELKEPTDRSGKVGPSSSRNVQLSSVISKLQGQLVESNHQIETLLKERESDRSHIRRLESDRNEVDANIVRVQQQLTGVTDENQLLLDRLSQLQSKNLELEQMVYESDQRMLNLSTSFASSTARIQVLEQSKLTLTQEIQKQQQKANDISQALMESHQQFQHSKQRVDELEFLQGSSKTQREELLISRRQAEERLEDCLIRMQQLEASNTSLDQTVTSLTSKLTSADKLIEDFLKQKEQWSHHTQELDLNVEKFKGAEVDENNIDLSTQEALHEREAVQNRALEAEHNRAHAKGPLQATQAAKTKLEARMKHTGDLADQPSKMETPVAGLGEGEGAISPSQLDVLQSERETLAAERVSLSMKISELELAYSILEGRVREPTIGTTVDVVPNKKTSRSNEQGQDKVASSKLNECRQELNDLTEERDSLVAALARNDSEMERLSDLISKTRLSSTLVASKSVPERAAQLGVKQSQKATSSDEVDVQSDHQVSTRDTNQQRQAATLVKLQSQNERALKVIQDLSLQLKATDDNYVILQKKALQLEELNSAMDERSKILFTNRTWYDKLTSGKNRKIAQDLARVDRTIIELKQKLLLRQDCGIESAAPPKLDVVIPQTTTVSMDCIPRHDDTFWVATKMGNAIFESECATYEIRKPYSFEDSPSFRIVAPPTLFQRYIQTSKLDCPSSIDVLVRIRGDRNSGYNLLYLTGESHVFQKSEDDDTWIDIGDVDRLDRPLGWVPYTETEDGTVKEKVVHLSLDKVLEDAVVLRQQYCQTTLRIVQKSWELQSLLPKSVVTLFVWLEKMSSIGPEGRNDTIGAFVILSVLIWPILAVLKVLLAK